MLQILYKRVAGLDVHKKTVVATRMRITEEDRLEWETKTFGTTTPELLELHDWLYEWECTHVAMESTGDYWKPVYNVLEDTFEVLVVNAKHVKHVPGRKTDVKDAEWLAELMMHGLLKPSFIPSKPQRVLRDLTRYRSKLVQERSRIVNRVQKLLEEANIKLSSVATDIMGVSAGNRGPVDLGRSRHAFGHYAWGQSAYGRSDTGRDGPRHGALPYRQASGSLGGIGARESPEWRQTVLGTHHQRKPGSV